MKIEKLESCLKRGYVDKKSCARCVHNVLRKCVDMFVDDRYCDIDNHKINYIESFSITCEYQKEPCEEWIKCMYLKENEFTDDDCEDFSDETENC